jgi:hypothetical protein
MDQNVSSRYRQVSAQSLPLEEALWQLPSQYLNIFFKPSVTTLSQQMGSASWGIVLVQLLSLVSITVILGALGHLIPSAALHAITALSIGSVRPFAWLPAPWNGITLVLASFFIGLGTAYPLSRLAGGLGTLLEHLYCLLLCTVPLVAVSGALLLIPATGWLVLLLVSVVSALFIYRMVLHTLIIMAVHQLRASQAIPIVLIIPIILFVAGLLIWTQGDAGVCEVFSCRGERPRREW